MSPTSQTLYPHQTRIIGGVIGVRMCSEHAWSCTKLYAISVAEVKPGAGIHLYAPLTLRNRIA